MNHPTTIQSSQFSLAELFLVTTFSAIVTGIYPYISPLVALTGGGALAVVGAVHWAGLRNILVGGLAGFISSGVIAILIIAVCSSDTITSVVIALLYPSVGYLLGAITAGFPNDDF